MRLMSLARFSLLLLILSMFNTSFSDDGSAKFQSFRTGPVSKPFQAKGGSRQHTGGEDGSEAVIGDEKRKVYTGPNPLHNR